LWVAGASRPGWQLRDHNITFAKTNNSTGRWQRATWKDPWLARFFRRKQGRKRFFKALAGLLAEAATWLLPRFQVKDGDCWKKTRTKCNNMNRSWRDNQSREACHLGATDAELVRRARQGDETAFHELVDRYAAELYGLARWFVGNAADAEDVLQETFAGAFRHLRSFEGRSSVKTWLNRILVRQAARHHRSRARQRTVPLRGLSDGSQAVLGGHEAEAPADDNDLRLDVLNLLDTLSPEHREVVVLRELQGMSYSEIAEVVGIPEGTVESRLFRARRELRERLKDYLP
jgi:RNA polymerase sigma-70 factor (ECF subfamily)